LLILPIWRPPGDTPSNCTDQCSASMVALCTMGTSTPTAPIVGYYLGNVSEKLLLPCPKGKFKPTLDFDVCGSCPSGKYSGGISSTYCIDCTPGKYGQASGVSACTGCEAGRYQPAAGETDCITCAAGSTAGASDGARTCTECSIGRYSVSSDVAECTACTAGEYQSSAGQTNYTACKNCRAGERKACGGVTEGYCAGCIPGRYAAEGTSSCIGCPAGYFQEELSQLECLACEQGTFQDTVGKSYCKEVKHGFTLSERKDSTGKRKGPMRLMPPSGHTPPQGGGGAGAVRGGQWRPRPRQSPRQAAQWREHCAAPGQYASIAWLPHRRRPA
jgi:hypothetical protein